jgi:hypothetical protein
MDRLARHDDGELPVFDADAPVASLHRPGHPSFSGRRTGSGRGVGIAVGALVLLTAGIAVGGILDPATPTSSPSSSGAATVTDGPCLMAPRNEVPAFSLGGEGSDEAIDGKSGYSSLPTGEVQGPGWIVPGISADGVADVASSAALEVRASAGFCVRHILADYARAALRDPAPRDIRRLTDAQVQPPTQSPTFGLLPDGDWVVRIRIHFEPGGSGREGLVVGERYFRVRVGPGPFMAAPTPSSTPRPAVRPAVPCSPAPATIDDIVVVFSKLGGEPVVGLPDGSSPPLVKLQLGDNAELAVVGDMCATTWNITRADATTGLVVDVTGTDNPADDPAYASQNHWRLSVEEGTFDVVASLHFGPGLDIVRIWRVVVAGFTIPEVVLRADGGDTVAALPGCGISIQLANGYAYGDSCGSMGFPAGLEELHVPAWSRVRLEITGWTISSWNGQCGRVVTDNGSEIFEYSCNVGGYSVEPGAFPPGPAQFLARPGLQVMQLWVTGVGEAGTFSGPMFALVVGE